MNDDVKAVLQAALVKVLVQRIEPLFKPGTKFAVIARTPGNDEADVIVTDDDLDAIKALIDRSKTREVTT